MLSVIAKNHGSIAALWQYIPHGRGNNHGEKLYNGESIVYFRITGWPEMGVVVGYQVPLPTCLKFFVILTNEKAKVSYQTFIKELSNPPRIDTVVIYNTYSNLYHIRPNEGLDICTTTAFIHGRNKSMSDI